MKQFELKFYKEWYDALSELSHDDRANAVLALLEYLYDGIVPDDQFIRIVTTLMRNKIDREKASFERRNKCACKYEKPAPEHSTTQNDVTSTEQVADENEIISTTQQAPEPETISIPDIECEISEKDAQCIDEIIQQHYNQENQLLLNFCKRHRCDIKEIASQAKKIMTQWVAAGSWLPSKLPDRSKESILYKIDKLALANIQSSLPSACR